MRGIPLWQPIDIAIDSKPAQNGHMSRGDGQQILSERSKPNWCEIATLVLEFLGIIGLTIYCVYTYKEFKTFDSERQIMEQEFKDGRLNFQAAQRAWLATYEVKLITNNSAISFTVNFKNTGETPAINVKIVFLQSPEITTNEWLNLPPPTPRGFVPPQGIYSLTSPTFGQELVKYMQSGEPYYLYGEIWYDDIFGRHHWSQFCYMTTGRFDVIEGPYHNSCDDSEVAK
jgi:hypothetical protein